MYAYLYYHREYWRVQSLHLSEKPDWTPDDPKIVILAQGYLTDPKAMLVLGHTANIDTYPRLLAEINKITGQV